MRSTLLILLAFLIGCSNNFEEANEIVKNSLRSPSSFHFISGKEEWAGKDKDGKPARIVRIFFDAQNAFGATVRECRLVAVGENTKYDMLKLDMIKDCENPHIDIRTMRRFNFGVE